MSQQICTAMNAHLLKLLYHELDHWISGEGMIDHATTFFCSFPRIVYIDIITSTFAHITL